VLVVMGPSWLTASDEPDGVPRLYDSRDPVRKEVEAALGVNRLVIPVLVGGAALPDPLGLPESLRPLCRQIPVEVHDGDGFDADADRLVGELQRRLTGGTPASTAQSLLPRSSEEVTGRDRAFRLIAERVVKGANPVVLCGPAGSGKTVTALEFARMHLPPERHRDIVLIDARKEFYELTLADAAGKRYPDEFYVDGGTFTSRLPFRSLKHRAVELLARHKALVILDGPGEAPYPRDSEAELNLARQAAGELAARGVLTVVTAREPDCWAGQDPIPLQGLSPENSRALLEHEFLRRAPTADVKTLAGLLGESELTALLGRGHPGELISAARRAAEAQAGGPKGPASGGAFTRLAQLARRGAEQLLGDPITPRATRSGEQSSGLGLIIICMVLLLVAASALVASYSSGSARWERMFYRLAATEEQVPPLGAGSGKKAGLGPGLLVEMGRVTFIVGGLLMIVIGRFFAREAAQLLPTAPWKAVGPRQLNLRSVFRLMYAGLVVWLAFSIIAHHYHTGPRILWMCNGNPFLQRNIDSSDLAKTRELQGLPEDDPQKMNGEPPSPGETRYSEYWWDCAFPYWLYFPYSFIVFVVTAPVILIVCFYAVCSNLWSHLITQPRTITDLPDDTRPDEIESRLRYYKLTYVEDLDRYLVLLLTLLSGWIFHEWLDSNNLTERGKEHTIEILLVTVVTWGVMFGILLLAYQPLYREAAKRIPEGPLHEDFRANHQPFRFFFGAITGSFYFWLGLAAGAAGLLSTVLRVSGR
jgi:hypothetical protein